MSGIFRAEPVARPPILNGPFGGTVIRAELVELQKADVGRKYGRKDRRPLDPPPVAQLKLFRVLSVGTSNQQEVEVTDYNEVNSIGFVCHVDLFPVSPTAGTDARQASRAATTQARSSHTERTQATGPSSYMHPYREWAPMQLGFPAVLPAVLLSASLNPESARGLVRPSAQAPYSAGPLASTISYIGPGMDARGNPDPDVVAHSGDRLVRESLKCTASLVGSKVAAAVCVEYQEKNAFMFVFADISVKVEGTYLLRYRAFDIFAQAHGTNGHPVLAECYGGTFKVYSTKDFPGLHASTDLTKHLSCRNVRVASRENERERKRRRTVQTSYVPIAPAIQRSDRRSTWSPCSNWNVGNRHGVSTKL